MLEEEKSQQIRNQSVFFNKNKEIIDRKLQIITIGLETARKITLFSH